MKLRIKIILVLALHCAQFLDLQRQIVVETPADFYALISKCPKNNIVNVEQMFEAKFVHPGRLNKYFSDSIDKTDLLTIKAAITVYIIVEPGGNACWQYTVLPPLADPIKSDTVKSIAKQIEQAIGKIPLWQVSAKATSKQVEA